MAGDIAKIDRIQASRNLEIGVDLFLDKRTGLFFAAVNGKRIEANTKGKAVERITAALDKVLDVEWRQVILLRVDARQDDDVCSHENDLDVFSAGCSFTYLRRERAKNPTKKGATIEREHADDFEVRVKREVERHSRHEYNSVRRKEVANEVEKRMRDSRAALVRVGSPYSSHFARTKEYELPYTPEAWAGIARIARTLREMQDKLDTFAKQATPATLAQLAKGDVFKLLPPAGKAT